jgi:putative nucleotidyltransferase with HDIG domain
MDPVAASIRRPYALHMIAVTDRTPSALPEPVRLALAQKVAGGKLELPVLPEVATRVVQLCNDEGADPRELAVVIRRDQAMAAHLMRLANSSLYAPVTPLVSLDQVVSRLGMKKVREIALIISCQSKVFAVPGHEARLKVLFRHSLGAAAFAQEIARSRRWNVEEAFLAGLLHDLGRPVLIQAIVDLCRTEGLCPTETAMDVACDILHTRVGAELVKAWNLPVRLSEAVLWHHDPQRSESARNLTMTTALADDLSHLVFGPKRLEEDAMRGHPLCAPLNMYPDEMEALLAKREAIQKQVEALA